MGDSVLRAFEILFLFCNLLSGIASLLAVRHLCRLSPTTRSTIFWQQMFALCLTDFFIFVERALMAVLDFQNMSVDLGRGPLLPVNLGSGFGMWVELSGCMLEVHISLGFAAAACQSRRYMEQVRRFIPACFVFAMAPTLGGGCFEFVENAHIGHRWSRNCNLTWGISVLVCCCISVTTYILASAVVQRAVDGLTIVHAERRQAYLLVKRRAMVRGASYLAAFVLTLLPATIHSFFFYGSEVYGTDGELFSAIPLGLNGLVNVGLYIFWNTRTNPLAQEQTSAASFQTDMDLMLLVNYFDISNATRDAELNLDGRSEMSDERAAQLSMGDY